MDKWKHSQEEAEPGRNSDVEKVRREKIKNGKNQKREDAGARKGREVAKHCVFPMFCGSGKSKIGSLKRRVRSQPAWWKMSNCTSLWRATHFKETNVKAPPARTTFGSARLSGVKQNLCTNVRKTTCSGHVWKLRCGKVDALVARSAFWSEQVENTACSDEF